MDEELVSIGEDQPIGQAVFIPSHLTRALVSSGVSLAAGVLALVAGGYAVREFSRVRREEVVAMIRPPN